MQQPGCPRTALTLYDALWIRVDAVTQGARQNLRKVRSQQQPAPSEDTFPN